MKNQYKYRFPCSYFHSYKGDIRRTASFLRQMTREQMMALTRENPIPEQEYVMPARFPHTECYVILN